MISGNAMRKRALEFVQERPGKRDIFPFHQEMPSYRYHTTTPPFAKIRDQCTMIQSKLEEMFYQFRMHVDQLLNTIEVYLAISKRDTLNTPTATHRTVVPMYSAEISKPNAVRILIPSSSHHHLISYMFLDRPSP